MHAATIVSLICQLSPQDPVKVPDETQVTEFSTGLSAEEFRVGEIIEDLAFTDLDGKAGRLSDYADRAALVVVIRDVGCPVGKKYGLRTAEIERAYGPRNVAFLYVNPSIQDSPEKCRAEIADFGFAGRYVPEREGRFGWHLRVRTTTDVFVLDADRRLRYRGAIDDQMGRGATKPEPSREFLKEALEAVLADRRVRDPATTAPGCKLEFGRAPPPEPPAPAIDWHGRISRIVQERCQACHRTGGPGPFALAERDDLFGRAAMIRQVVTDRVMPPWYASDRSARFENDTRLSVDERLDLLKWLQSGAPAGDPAQAPPPKVWPEEWLIGTPDVIVETNKDFQVPATGLLDYVQAFSDYVAPEDIWVQAAQVLPRHPEVVHHLAVHVVAADGIASGLFDGYLPGKAPTVFPEGTARKIKKGSSFHFSTHYTPNGKACVDRIRIGLILAKEPPQRAVQGFYVRETKFTIPPLVSDFALVSEKKLQYAGEIRRLIPHMHLRGKSVKVEIEFPDGRSPIMPLEITRWDPNWQFAYVLSEPIQVPRDTLVRVTCVFDNSPENPWNPDPNAIVKQGPQIFDEMAESLVEVTRTIRRREFAPDSGPDEDGADEEPSDREKDDR